MLSSIAFRHLEGSRRNDRSIVSGIQFTHKLFPVCYKTLSVGAPGYSPLNWGFSITLLSSVDVSAGLPL